MKIDGGVGARLSPCPHRPLLAEAPPLPCFAARTFCDASFWLDCFALADFGGADFVRGFVAGALESAPHVPTGDRAVWAPALAEFQEFLRLGHVLLAVGDGPALFDAEVVDGKHVGAPEAENQKHFDGPGADPAH
jgi:hypothetical protein